MALGTATEASFAKGQEAYLADDFPRAAGLMEAYAQAYPSTVKGIEARYWHGMSLLAMGRSIQARDELLLVKGAAASTRALKALASRAVARSYLVEGELDRAEQAYTRLRTDFSREYDEAETLHALATIADRQGNRALASRYRRELGKKYPQSPYYRNPRVSSSGQAGGAGTAPGRQFTVQVGLFSTRERASQHLKRLNRAGVEAIILRRTVNGKVVYLVQAGSFSTRSGAEKRAARLKSKGFEALVKP
jgi:tetratricopeptide (TPR) repeat protein